MTKINLLYDISVLGAAAVDNRSRTGVYAVIKNLVNGLADNPEIDLTLTSEPELMKFSLSCYKNSSFRNAGFKAHQDILCNYDSQDECGTTRKNLNYLRRFLLRASNICNHKKINVDIFHSTFFKIPDFIQNIPDIKKVITIYDLIPILHPEYFTESRPEFFKTIIKSIKSENYVISISQSTRNDLCNYLPSVSPDNVKVIYPAASSLFHKVNDQVRINFVKNKYKIPNEPYILSLCTLEPRKNIALLIRAFRSLIETEKIPLNLVLVGGKGWKYDSIFAEISKNKSKNRIFLTGYALDGDLASIYSGAMMFVYPSIFEGFGLPPLEAMQCEIPVITSNASSLPEVVGDAGIMVDPHDQDGLAQSILNLFKDSNLRATLSQRSKKQAAKFNWKNNIDETVDFYKEILRPKQQSCLEGIEALNDR
ncbi:MAG: glycosyltransferase family 1 protein [Candidatus Omnitrophota bacterium]|jgi:glycosyltransferase involved in cell wall biosynthesis